MRSLTETTPRVGGWRPSREQIRAGFWGTVWMLALAALVVVGSRKLAHFDAALVGYTFSVLFATFAIIYR